jgi:hypothetical protein
MIAVATWYTNERCHQCWCSAVLYCTISVYNAFLDQLHRALRPPEPGPPDFIDVVLPNSKGVTTLRWKLPYWGTWEKAGAIRYGDIQKGKYHDDVAIDRLRRILKVLHRLHSTGLEPEVMKAVWLRNVRDRCRNAEFVVAREGRALLQQATGGTGSSIDAADTAISFECIDEQHRIWKVIDDDGGRTLVENIINWDRRFTKHRVTLVNGLIDLQRLNDFGDTGMRK